MNSGFLCSDRSLVMQVCMKENSNIPRIALSIIRPRFVEYSVSFTFVKMTIKWHEWFKQYVKSSRCIYVNPVHGKIAQPVASQVYKW